MSPHGRWRGGERAVWRGGVEGVCGVRVWGGRVSREGGDKYNVGHRITDAKKMM